MQNGWAARTDRGRAGGAAAAKVTLAEAVKTAEARQSMPGSWNTNGAVGYDIEIAQYGTVHPVMVDTKTG